MNLLIVEDDEMTCLCVRKWVQEMELKPITRIDSVYSAEDALELAQIQRIDFLLSDIRMVEMNGLELIEQMKKYNPSIKTLILTAYASFEYAQQAIQLGVQGFLLKPFEKEKLYRELIRMLGNTESVHDGAAEHRSDDPIQTAKNYVRDNLYKEINMAVIANKLNMSYSHFSRTFRQQTGLTFSAYVTNVKMHEAARLLLNDYSIAYITEKLCYQSRQNLTRAFIQFWQCSPNDYKRKMRKQD